MSKIIFWKVYATPTTITVMSIVGLSSALMGDGIWDVAAWLMLGSVLLLGASKLIRSRSQ